MCLCLWSWNLKKGSNCNLCLSETWTVTCIWSDSWRFRWPCSERTAGCPSSRTGTPCRSEVMMTPCLSSAASAVEGLPSGVRSPSLPQPAKGNCLKVSTWPPCCAHIACINIAVGCPRLSFVIFINPICRRREQLQQHRCSLGKSWAECANTSSDAFTPPHFHCTEGSEEDEARGQLHGCIQHANRAAPPSSCTSATAAAAATTTPSPPDCHWLQVRSS